jgi:hypothetical protein
MHRVMVALVLVSALEAVAGGATAEQVDAALAAKDWSKAETLAREWAKQQPAESAPWIKLSVALHGQKKYPAAIEAIGEAKKRGAPPMWTFVREVRARSQMGELDKAFELFDVAVTRGFAMKRMLETDPDFEPLRKDARYPALLAKVDRNANPCLYQPESRQLDFWIGEWNVTANGNPVGESRIERILNGCALLENWTSLGGTDGKSFNVYDTAQKKWRQTWVDSSGRITDYVGSANAKGELVFDAKAPGPDGAMQQLRMTFTRLNDNQVRQYIETSKDGKKWEPSFDGLYTRKPPSAPAAKPQGS